jgi:RimJ/RimL family protein N-acetyltransferase
MHVDQEATLADGTSVHLRDISADDGPALVAFHLALSPESVARRFFGAHPRLSPSEVERFTKVDGVDRVALVAERDGQLLAVARYDRSSEKDEAEVAFVVADAFQGRGLGTILLEHLLAAARRHGVKRIVADTMADNHRMLAMLRRAGGSRRYQRSGGVIRVEVDL